MFIAQEEKVYFSSGPAGDLSHSEADLGSRLMASLVVGCMMADLPNELMDYDVGTTGNTHPETSTFSILQSSRSSALA